MRPGFLARAACTPRPEPEGRPAESGPCAESGRTPGPPRGRGEGHAAGVSPSLDSGLLLHFSASPDAQQTPPPHGETEAAWAPSTPALPGLDSSCGTAAPPPLRLKPCVPWTPHPLAPRQGDCTSCWLLRIPQDMATSYHPCAPTQSRPAPALTCCPVAFSPPSSRLLLHPEPSSRSISESKPRVSPCPQVPPIWMLHFQRPSSSSLATSGPLHLWYPCSNSL